MAAAVNASREGFPHRGNDTFRMQLFNEMQSIP